MSLSAVLSVIKSPWVWGAAVLATTALVGICAVNRYRARHRVGVAPELYNIPADDLLNGTTPDWDAKIQQLDAVGGEQQSWLKRIANSMFGKSEGQVRQKGD